MSPASSVGMVVVGLVVGVMVGIGGVYVGIIPDPEAQVLQVKLESSMLELSGLEDDIARIEASHEAEVVSKQDEIITLETRMERLNDEIASKDIVIENLEADKQSIQIELDRLTIEIDQHEDLELEISSLQAEIESLGNQVSFIVSLRENLEAQLASRGRDLTALRREFDLLQEDWDLWKKHSALAPQSRSDFEFWKSIPETGEWLIDRTSILISFPDPSNCLSVGVFVATESMRPAIGGGHQVIETTCFEISDLRAGDIISYRHPLGIITHQIVEVRPDGVITKGINLEDVDPSLVEWGDIQALVVAIIY